MITGKASYSKLHSGDLLIIRCLYLFHLLMGRRLQLSFISRPDALIFSGSAFTLCWKVSGCHQIHINDIVLPGNTSSIRLSAKQLSKPLRIYFYGCRQTIEKTYAMEPLSLRIKQLSHIPMQDVTLPETKLDPLWNLAMPEHPHKIALPAPVFPAALSFRAERCPARMRRPALHVHFETCNLPQLHH